MNCDAARRQRGQESFGEVQSRCRRRHRAFELREHGLIVAPVALIGCTPRGDVGRQRHGAALVDGLVEHRPVECERQRHFAPLAFGLDGGVELAEEADVSFAPEAEQVAGGKPLGGLHEGAPV